MKSSCKISSSLWPTHSSTFPVARFKKIATVAATRVETMRDLLVNWNFFIETKVVSSWPICANFGGQKCHLCLFVSCLLQLVKDFFGLACQRCSLSGRSRTSCRNSEGDVLSWKPSWVVPPWRNWLCPWSSQGKWFVFNALTDQTDFGQGFFNVT